jgi:glycosyltransferase involved in cell wall biosynthesis
MQAPLITVVITTYNYGRYVEQAIDSVVSQDFPQEQVQIVVVDDGSTDDTAERVKKYGARVEYFRQANEGQASALNLGISKARGEILALLDADDLFLPGKLARVAEAFERNPAVGMVYHPMQEWHMQSGERRDSKHPLVSGDVHKELDRFFFYIPHPTSCVAFRRKCLHPLLPIPEEIRMLADGYLVTLFPFVSPILALPEVLVVYRIHGANQYFADEHRMSAEDREKRLGQRQIQYGAMCKWLAEHGYTEEQPAVRSFLDRWTLWRQSDEFLLKAPGRLRFFSHLLLYNRSYGPHLSRKLRIINRVNAIGALVVGYKRFHLLERWRLALTAWFKRSFRHDPAGGAGA